MSKIKGFVVTMVIMLGVAMISLLAVSALTYLFKWQADKAMIGIIVTYIFAGFIGGFYTKRTREKQFVDGNKIGIGKKAIEAFVVGNVFMLILLLLSIFVLQNSFGFSSRFLMIWGLLVSSTFLGRIL